MEIIRQKIGRIREHLSIIHSIKADCRDKFSSDPVYRGALLHYLFLLSDSCIVLAEMVIKHKGLRIPQSYASRKQAATAPPGRMQGPASSLELHLAGSAAL
ncbi:MAG: DUF86 domain-containing protein [Desulfuromonadales bacterium]|nr:DUF86 domain-containing protein [Desulfuromonadales bacterium]